MANNINFTKRELEALTSPPKGKRAYFNDTKIKGLQLAITDKGTMTFVVYRRIDGKPTRVKLGGYPDMSPETARKEAYKVLGDIAKGENPAANKRAERAQTVTLLDAFETYVDLKRHHLKEKTLYDYQKLMDRALKDWHKKRLIDITKAHVQRKHLQLTTNSGGNYANAAMRVLRAVFNFAQHQYEDAQGIPQIPVNPVDILSKTKTWHRTKPRDTYIQPHELPAWFTAVNTLKQEGISSVAHTVGDYLLVLLFTGLRRQEGAKLAWADVSLEGKTLTVRDTKNHTDHTLPLSDFLHALLSERFKHRDSDFVFPGSGDKGYLIEPRNYVATVVSLSGVNFTLHELRRTFSTIVSRLDINAYKQKRLLNHKASDVTAGYTPIDIEQLRGPMQEVTDFILSTANVKPKGKVIGINKTKNKSRGTRNS